jgi:hypothetical protein
MKLMQFAVTICFQNIAGNLYEPNRFKGRQQIGSQSHFPSDIEASLCYNVLNNETVYVGLMSGNL